MWVLYSQLVDCAEWYVVRRTGVIKVLVQMKCKYEDVVQMKNKKLYG